MDARKCRTRGQGRVIRGSAMEETRLNAGAAKAAHVQRPEEDDALTGAAASRRSRFWSPRSSGARTVLPHRSPPGSVVPDSGKRWPVSRRATAFREGGNVAWAAYAPNVQRRQTSR